MSARSCGLLVKAVDRQDREDLVDPPRVEQGLKHAEVHEIEVGHAIREMCDRFGQLVTESFESGASDCPEELLAGGAASEIHVAEVEEVRRLGEGVLGVGVDFG